MGKTLLLFLLIIHFQSFTQELEINEVMSNNLQVLLDEDGDETDWIELYNPTPNPIFLADYFLTDELQQLQKWNLPPVTLQANGFFLVYASDKNKLTDSTFHSNFKLAKSGTDLILSKIGNNIVEALTIPALPLDVSYGKSNDGGDTWVYFETPTPHATNNLSQAFTCILSPPEVLFESGNYPISFLNSLASTDPGVSLKYSLDGKDPATGIAYSAPFLIENVDYPNYYSTIPSNPAFDYPQGEYSEFRADTRGWVPPYSNVENIILLKVQAFKQNCISSPIVSKTYLIANPDNLGIVSISADSTGFFSNETGIYVYGNDSLGNYTNSGNLWERQVTLSYFNADKELVFSENCGVKISGHGSRHSAVKNLQLDFRDEYGAASIDTVLFPHSLLRKYESLSLRAGGHRPDCLPRDDLSSDLFSHIELDHSEYEFVNVYLNGEYWGIHALKERLNADYIADKYDIEKEELAILGNNGQIEYGTEEDSLSYREIIDFVVNNDLNIEANYQHLEQLIDIDNFTDYLCSEIFVGNADWPNSNIKFWRKRVDLDTTASSGHDGRWRWLLFDLDGAYGGTCNDVFQTFNTLSWAQQTTPNFENYTRLIIALMNTDKFRKTYIKRMCDLLNSSFLPAVTRTKLASVLSRIDPEMDKQINRWRYPSNATTLVDRYNEIPTDNKWNYLKNKLDTFLILRPHYTRMHMYNLWLLEDSAFIKLQVNDPEMGEIQVNTLRLNENLERASQAVYPWMGTYFKGIPFPLKAMAKPGYRFVKWLEIDSTNANLDVRLSSDSLFTAIFEPDENYVPDQPLVLNEVMAKNTSTVQDQFNEYEDWVEIYNPNNYKINLNGYYLSDEETYPKKYKISTNIYVPENGFLLFWCDEQVGQGANHTNFKLAADGGFVSLSKPINFEYVDSIHYPVLVPNMSYGRATDGNPEWKIFPESTPERSNQTAETNELKKDEFTIFPNPSNGNLIHFSRTISGGIYDLKGQLLLEFENKKQLSLEGLVNGFYILRDGKGSTKKFVLQRN